MESSSVGVAHSAALLSVLREFAEPHFFPEEGEMGLVGTETQHDQIRIQSVHAVSRVGVVVWPGSL